MILGSTLWEVKQRNGRRWSNLPPFVMGEDNVAITLSVGHLLPGLWYAATRNRRTVAPELVVSHALSVHAVQVRNQVLAQALGVAAGVRLRRADNDPAVGVMHVLPQDLHGLPIQRSCQRERHALKMRAMRHHLELMRLGLA